MKLTRRRIATANARRKTEIGTRGVRCQSALLLIIALTCLTDRRIRGAGYGEIDAPPHRYRERTPKDRFTRLKESLESGTISLPRTNEKAFVIALLKTLQIPVSSQMLVFSTTSLQLNLISPANPRALYFSDDLYLGYVPGGRIEIVSLDAELGG